jgi:hypothetical protein
MALGTGNPSIWEAESGGSEFEASLGYLARVCLKKTNKKLHK